MLNPEILTFLETIKENNNREWFTENKLWYDKIKSEFDLFATKLIAITGKIDKEIAYLEPKNCTYRIYRDTRFSSDKTPYKCNMGVFMVKGGKSSGNAGYYFHLEPDLIFLSGGIYMPLPETLKKIRSEIYNNIDEFIEIIENKHFRKHFSNFDQEQKLKNPPKDYPKDFEHVDLLKYKSYTVSKMLDKDTVFNDKFFNQVEDVFSALAPFNKFLNQAISV